ncbi:PorT family protein [candidate division KSB1 bacterium]|nr:PorT family protein [candidate division KSB1 bacterium]
MKKIILLFALLISASSVHSQAALLVLLFGDKVATENFYFSLKAGANFANLNGLDHTNMRPGAHFGLVTTIKINDKFYLAPEFTPLSRKGARNIPVVHITSLPRDTQRTLNYIDVPIIARYYVHERFGLGAGPQFSFLTSATDSYTTDLADEEVEYSIDIKDDLNPFEFGLVIDITFTAWKARKGKGLNIHARYGHGLTNILKNNSDESLTNSFFQMSASFPFVQ